MAPALVFGMQTMTIQAAGTVEVWRSGYLVSLRAMPTGELRRLARKALPGSVLAQALHVVLTFRAA